MVNVQGGLRVFSVYFSEGWCPRNEALLEAVVKQAKVVRHPWLAACDANMCPEDFEKSHWFQRGQMIVVVPKEASTSRSKGSKGEWDERIYDNVIACQFQEKHFADEGDGRFRIEAAQSSVFSG